MSAELLAAIGSIGTFVVIAATAVTAVVQLRHMRGSNQIAALTEMRETIESEKFVHARHRVFYEIVPGLTNIELRKRMMTRVLDADLNDISFVGNVFETLGAFVKFRIIDKIIACDLWGGVALMAWQHLLPIVALRRRVMGPSLWENFEYFAALASMFWRRNQSGSYPSDTPRLEVPDEWLATDLAAKIVPEQWKP